MKMPVVVFGCAALGVALAAPVPAQQPPTPQQQIAALKASLAANQKALHRYEWVETVIVSLKGEEKSRLQNRCYYGADGQLEKVQVSAPPEQKKMRGLRGKIAAQKKEEMTDYMKEAVALVKSYVPPDPARIQAAKEKGKLSFQPLSGGPKQVRLTIADYEKAGDSLALDVDFTNDRLLGAKVASYLSEPSDAVTLDVSFDTFTDGVTSYTKDIVLNAPAKEMRVEVQNGGYRLLQQ